MATRESLDPYLLRVLYTLLTEKSVSRAALRLNQSQPAMSVALKRLREIVDDPILVRGKGGMVPTERGQDLLEHARVALNEIARIVEPKKPFDPMRSTREFRLGTRDHMTMFLVPRLVERLRSLAPNARLHISALGADFDYELGFEHESLDVAVGNWLSPPDHYRMQPLFEDEVASLISRHHRFAERQWTLEEFLRLPHIAPTSTVAGQRTVIDAYLASQRLQRNVVVTMSYFSLIPYTLAETDLVFTASRRLCEHFAATIPLKVVKPPIDFPPMRYSQLWHERTHQSPECTWLRRQISEAARSLGSSAPTG